MEQDPSLGRSLAEGAVMRLLSGARCFEAYRAVLWSRVPNVRARA